LFEIGIKTEEGKRTGADQEGWFIWGASFNWWKKKNLHDCKRDEERERGGKKKGLPEALIGDTERQEKQQ